ncbi:MAG: dTMP kinase [Chloroflexi bacterium]|nr:dTMP kinase [Chloroflexota bacterium]
MRQLIQPALAQGKIVLCDRYADSTMAYQGYGRGLDLAMLQTLTHIATGGLKPAVTILLDIDVKRGLRRRQSGGDEMNRLDLEGIAFHQRVRQGYHTLAAQEPARWITVDGDRPAAAIQQELREILMRVVGK